MHIKKRHIITSLLFLLPPLFSGAQSFLSKKISITIHQKELAVALQAIAKEGGFHFSYNSDILSTDSIVSLSVHQQPVKKIVQRLLGHRYSYSETAGYVIIHQKKTDKRAFMVSGAIFNRETGAPLANVSVYESLQFQSDLTDKKGRYQLHLHTASKPPIIHVSRFYFNDTSFTLQQGYDQSVNIAISPIRSIRLHTVTVKPNAFPGQAWVNRFFISSRQKVRDMNLNHFFVRQPFQYAIWPGLGTHGKLSAQMNNKFSFNILGGYSAGLNGVELGGLFNIDKKDVKYTQAAGLFNSVGGKMTGFQAAGLYNNIQSGMEGAQIAGLANVVKKEVNGIQLAGIMNRSKSINGVQLAGILNITSSNHGLQIGLVNIADTASGYTIGLINIIQNKGYHKLSASWNEALDLNLAYKTGRKKLYNILLTGLNRTDGHSVVSFGYGLGRSFDLSSDLSFTTEITEQSILNGDWGSLPLLVRIQPAIALSLSQKTALFAGPAFSVYFPGNDKTVKGFRIPIHSFSLTGSIRAWFGIHAGITIF